MVHDQLARPFASVVVGVSPCAVLALPAGVTYEMAQLVCGAAWTVTDARPPGRPPWTAVNATPVGATAGSAGAAGADVVVADAGATGTRSCGAGFDSQAIPSRSPSK